LTRCENCGGPTPFPSPVTDRLSELIYKISEQGSTLDVNRVGQLFTFMNNLQFPFYKKISIVPVAGKLDWNQWLTSC
jgi:hypothetical protein